jgi:hypothetical protein
VTAQLVGVTKARQISVVTGIGIALWALSRDLRYAALLAGLFAVMNFAALRREGPGPRTPPVPAPTPLHRARAGGPSPEHAEAMAWDRVRRRDADGARRLASGLPPARKAHVEAAAALVADDSTGALGLLERAFAASPPPNTVSAGLVADAGIAALLAERLLERGDRAGADAAAALAEILYFAERFPEAALVSERVFADGRVGRAHSAFSAACAWSRAGDPERALDWLGRSVDAGFDAGRLLDGEPDLAAVRTLPGWATLRARLA